MQKAVMDLWKPGGKEWEISISIRNEDPAVIVSQLSYFQAEAIKEMARSEKTTCLYCGKTFDTEDQRNGHLSVCEKRRALNESRR